MSALTDTIDIIIKDTSSSFILDGRKYKLAYNELDENKDSFGVLLDSSKKPFEVVTDLIGDSVKCSFNLDIYYRVIKPHGGSSDLVYQSVLDSILDYMVTTFIDYEVSSKVTLNKVSILSFSVLNAVYSSGTKDFKGNITCEYERRL